MNRFKIMTAAAGLAASLSFAMPAWADVIQTFNLAWSGAQFGNTATATGFITLDETLLGDPFNIQPSLPSSIVTGLSITVSGAGAGNGTFGIGYFSSVYLNSDGATLNFTKNLVSQAAGSGLWGGYDFNGYNYTGDFNLFSNSSLAPNGTDPFELTTGAGSSDRMVLTSFATAVPEPSSLFLLAFGALGLAFLSKRIRRAD
jgi:opacity protein-like surface antigen